ncbi:MAG: peptidylprolyl isomerase [Clostridiales bacterium]|nr:peptidylprolyl isomerase [Clostridiales bacterium]
MKIIKKLVIAIIGAAFMLSSAGTVLADETTATSGVSGIDVTKLTFETIYGKQLSGYLNHQYVFEGEKIPVVESNYYFIKTYGELCQYAAYGYLPATAEGYIDLSASYGNEGQTYADYFVQQSELYLKRIYIYKQRAAEAGLTLGDEDKKAIDNEIDSRYENQAKPAGVSLDYILKLFFGPGCNEKTYRALLENAALASKYQQKYYEDFKVPEDQKNVPSITYALFYAPKSSASDDDKKKAEASAKEMLGKCKSIEDLKTLGTAAKSAGTCRDAGTLPVQKGKMVPAFEAWAYGEGRKAGEMDVIYADEYGYFCVGYNGMVELDESEKKDMASNALTAEVNEAIKTGKYTLEKKDVDYSKILLIVFGSIAGVAVLVLIVVVVKTYGNSNKNGKKTSKAGKSSGSKNSGKSGSSGKSSSSGSKKKSGNKKKH